MAAMEILEARIMGTNQGQDFNIVLHFRQQVEDVGTAEELADFVQNNIVPHLADASSQDAVYTQTLARQLTPEKLDPAASTVTPNQAGTVAEDSLPSFVSVIMQERTGFASRRKRGRIYLPAIPVTFVEDGKVSAAGTSRYNTEISGIMSAVNGVNSEWDLGIFSRTEAEESSDPYSAFTPVTSLSINPIVGTQRRRRIGHGS